MPKRVGWLWVVGIFGLSAAANAQILSPSTPPVTAFDGTYAFVSSAKVNETYSWTETHSGSGRCPDLRPRGPLTIVNGHARYNLQEGTVGPQGELVMRALILHSGGHSEIMTFGRIDGNGTVRARRIAYNCSHDLIWQKQIR